MVGMHTVKIGDFLVKHGTLGESLSDRSSLKSQLDYETCLQTRLLPECIPNRLGRGSI
jgi:hypothetical protein